MSQRVKPEKFLDEISEDLGEILADPHTVDYRSEEDQIIELYPDHLSFREAELDEANQNVTVRTNLQTGDERYTVVRHNENYSLIESLAEVCIDGKTAISETYYMVIDDQTLMYDGHGWEEKYNPTVEDVAGLVPELRRQAEKYQNLSE